MRVFKHIGPVVRTISNHDNMDNVVKPGDMLHERPEPPLDREFQERFLIPHIPVSQGPTGPVFWVPAEDLQTVQP
jgi:hypothetical protein